MFSLDKLKVYDKALANAASLAQRSRSWDKRHAVTDQLLRASESFVLNLAEGARLRSAAKRQHVLDYAIQHSTRHHVQFDVEQALPQ
jgi:four helix bundle protein